MAPDFARMLIGARGFSIKESPIDNHYENKRGSPRELAERLYIDLPHWLPDACRDGVANHFVAKQNE